MSTAIDLTREKPLSLEEAARAVPGEPVHPMTIHRWIRRGLRGVHLESVCVGAKRMVTVESLHRFFALLGESDKPHSTR